MMPDAIDDDAYKKIYTDGFLGLDGYLTRAMRQLLNWHSSAIEGSCLASFKVFDVQMGVPGLRTDMFQFALIHRIASDLKSKLRANFGLWGSQPDWSIPVYLLGERSLGHVGIWKTYEEPVHVAKVWFSAAFDNKGHKPSGKPLVEVMLLDPVSYANPNSPSGELRLAFETGTVKYLEKGKFPVKQAPKSILELYAETSKTRTAQTRWMPYKSEEAYGERYGGTDCDHVSLSKDGSLLGFVNTGNSPMFMVQTSAKSIICQISPKKMEELYTAWKFYETRLDQGLRRKYQEGLDDLFQQLKSMLSGDERAWGGQLWAPTPSKGGGGPFPRMIEDLIGEMRSVIHDASFDPTQPEVRVEAFVNFEPKRSGDRKDTDDYQYNAIWQPAYKEGATRREIWIWKMGRSTPSVPEAFEVANGGSNGGSPKNKFPAAKLDLLRSGKPYEYMYILDPFKWT